MPRSWRASMPRWRSSGRWSGRSRPHWSRSTRSSCRCASWIRGRTERCRRPAHSPPSTSPVRRRSPAARSARSRTPMARSADLPLRVLPSRPDVRRRRTAPDPCAVRLTAQQALDARSAIIMPDGLIDYWHALYEQRRRVGLGPWPGAADLASYIVTEKVDALRARLMKTIFVEPVWVVEGWGEAAKRAPIVEEFHQWKVEEERLQSKLGRVLHLALIEGTGI